MIVDKIKSREELVKISELAREGNLKVGFTSGVFDILHYGHASYLEQAKSKCDVLIVAVNSDESVKENKGPNRPIITERERVGLVAALECVDYAFIFFETNNKNNILTIKPHFYIKGGDYKQSDLKSAEYMKEWGGMPIVVSLEAGLSSTNVINKIKGINPPIEKCKVVFLDRDGVLNENIHFLHEPEKLKILSGVVEGLKELQELGFKLVIVTNQQGIGLGYFTKEDLFKVNSKMLEIFHKNGILIDKIYFCPHTEADKCSCRKPEAGMLFRAKEELNIDMTRSFIIGDQYGDILAGKRAGVKTIQIAQQVRSSAVPSKRVYNFTEAVSWIKNL